MSDLAVTELGVWWLDGACLRLDEDERDRLFFPVETLPDGEEREPYYPPAAAKAICEVCPVHNECLQSALTVPIEVPDTRKKTRKEWVQGVWGSTSTYQRDLLRRRQDRKSCPSCHSTDILDDRTDQICHTCGASWPASY